MTCMRYSIVIEKSANGYGAYVPDLPGCAVVGDTLEETKKLKLSFTLLSRCTSMQCALMVILCRNPQPLSITLKWLEFPA